MGARKPSHEIGENGLTIVRYKLKESGLLIHELTGRDYGIDAIVEIFENSFPTGIIAYLQIKSTQKNINISKDGCISSPQLSISNWYYSVQQNIPLVLLYVNTKNEEIYYKILNGELSIDILKNLKQKSKNTRIPSDNILNNNYDNFINLVKNFYK